MTVLARVAVITSCATAFVGTAYVVGLVLSPPLSYTVSDNQRIERYNALSVEGAYDKKTRSQEFILGISRLRRRLLWDEGLLRGRVLETGAGCGGVLSYYDTVIYSSRDMQTGNGGIKHESPQLGGKRVTEVVLSDRSPGMVMSTAKQVHRRCGYWPYRYPDYDVNGVLTVVQKEMSECNECNIVSDGSGKCEEAVQADVTHGNHKTGFSDTCVRSGLLPSVIRSALPGNVLPLLNEKGRAELKRREGEMKGCTSGENMKEKEVFSVANYAAEQMLFSDNSFDAVVDMFGLCSYDDPVKALREMSRVCKPDGHILLLEHGKGYWSCVNDYLDKWAPRHAKVWGCWWNRNIQRYVRLAGLIVIKKEDRHFGTTHYIVAHPFKTMEEQDKYRKEAMII